MSKKPRHLHALTVDNTLSSAKHRTAAHQAPDDCPMPDGQRCYKPPIPKRSVRGLADTYNSGFLDKCKPKALWRKKCREGAMILLGSALGIAPKRTASFSRPSPFQPRAFSMRVSWCVIGSCYTFLHKNRNVCSFYGIFPTLVCFFLYLCE